MRLHRSVIRVTECSQRTCNLQYGGDKRRGGVAPRAEGLNVEASKQLITAAGIQQPRRGDHGFA